MVMLPAGWSLGGSVGRALLGVAVVATGLLVLRIVLGEEKGFPVCMNRGCGGDVGHSDPELESSDDSCPHLRPLRSINK